MMGWLATSLFALLTILLPTHLQASSKNITATTAATETTSPAPVTLFGLPFTDPVNKDIIRFSVGWMKNKYLTYKNNALQVQFKFPKQYSIVQIAFGASESQYVKRQIAAGDIEADFAKLFHIELPHSYEIKSKTKSKMWIAQISYMMYYSFYNKQWWEIDWDFYASAGIMGHFYAMQSQTDYEWELKFEDDTVMNDRITNPLDFIEDDFHMAFPVCLNADIWKATLSGCGVIHPKDIKNSYLQGSWSVGF